MRRPINAVSPVAAVGPQVWLREASGDGRLERHEANGDRGRE